MEIKLNLNGRTVIAQADPDTLLLDFVRAQGCVSVKRGCDTANCGLCTVLLDGKPVLSCSVLAARAAGHSVQTLEGLQSRGPGGGPVRFLQPGFCDEHHRSAAGKSGSYR